MKLMFNTMPLSTLAALCASPVLPSARLRAASPAVVSPLTANAPQQPHQVQRHESITRIALSMGATAVGYLTEGSKRGTKIDGFSGVPPRGRPV
jgi:hypothetical protein